jgi:hypothetical protein
VAAATAARPTLKRRLTWTCGSTSGYWLAKSPKLAVSTGRQIREKLPIGHTNECFGPGNMITVDLVDILMLPSWIRS